MCNLNNPLICSICAFEITKQHLSPGNLGNCLKLYVLENKSLIDIFQYISTNIESFQTNKEYNNILSTVCSHKNEKEILDFLPIVKNCNYRFDKWYLHYAILNKKEKVIFYLINHGCPLRQNHLQSAILSENEELVKDILKKFDTNLGEKIQKSIPEWLLQINNTTIIKICISYCIVTNTKYLITAATNRNYYILYLYLQKFGLHVNQSILHKIAEICNSNLIDEKNNKNAPYGGIHNDIQYIRSEEKSKWFKECIEWCEMSVSQRFFKFINDRNKLLLLYLEDRICKDVVGIVIDYL
jgi:hypothetical protein